VFPRDRARQDVFFDSVRDVADTGGDTEEPPTPPATT
jgi:hypothetical protein